MHKKILSIALLFFTILSGCYTVFNHPMVRYSDKLDVVDTTVLGEQGLLTRINYSDNCLRCHGDYNFADYYQPQFPKKDSIKATLDKVHRFNNIPWWSNAVWSVDQESNYDTGQTSRRSRRSYRKISSGGGGELQYMAAPGVVPLNSKSIRDNAGQVKSEQKKDLPTRQKEAPAEIKKNEDKKNKKKSSTKPNRRR